MRVPLEEQKPEPMDPAVQDVTNLQGLFTVQAYLTSALNTLRGISASSTDETLRDFLTVLRGTATQILDGVNQAHQYELGRVFSRMVTAGVAVDLQLVKRNERARDMSVIRLTNGKETRAFVQEMTIAAEPEGIRVEITLKSMEGI